MGKRSHEIVVQQASVPFAPPQQATDFVATETPSSVQHEQERTLMPAAQIILPFFLKLNRKGYFTVEELERIVFIVGGNQRRALQKILLGIYQRSLIKKDDEEARRMRLLLSLHDSEKLEENLEAGT